jgi:starch phosphorylase
MTTPIKVVNVKPKIPQELEAVRELSKNLWFAWNYDAEDFFRRMNPDLWEECNGNPVLFLGRLQQYELQTLAGDEGFLANMGRVKQDFDRYMSVQTNEKVFGSEERPFTVAYFTAECGLADCLPIYSGGLGILSGDHLKSASDLNLPIIGISLAYQKGYFRQYLTQDGWQTEKYPINQFETMPMRLIKDGTGNTLRISLQLKGAEIKVQAWEVAIGRTTLYLLDTNIKENPDWVRAITAELYGGDQEMRIQQEIVLGIGGVRLLKAMNIQPAVYHMNEGHSAFAIFERIRELRQEEGLAFNEALEYVHATNVFTTHTPVPAGIDRFHPDLMRIYLEDCAKNLGISFEVLLGYGRQDPRNRGEEFCMAVLALRLSAWINGVSKLHGEVSRKMWKGIWPKIPEIDLPIKHITNGVHIPSWISYGMAENYNRYLGPRWIEDPDNVKVWERVDKIPDTELWRTHERSRERLIAFTRERLKGQMIKRGVSNRDLAVADRVLNSSSLTIGYARRFAPYKRAHLILKDIKRLEQILTNPNRPVQIIFAGKAHPQDDLGKELIKHLVQISTQENFRRHMVFLEDYDMEMARYLVQGVDVWMNTPRRPLEACGTSGMKAVANGALHFSILDGWWDEGYDREIGWAIGNGEEYEDHAFQDEMEANALYDILEKDVVPLFYNRGPDGLPNDWLAMMKSSLHKLCPMFNTHRMVEDYWDHFYLPAAEQAARLHGRDWTELKDLSRWFERVMFGWKDIQIKDIRLNEIVDIEVDKPYHVEADIFMGELQPDDIVVEAYFGRLDQDEHYQDRETFCLQASSKGEDHVMKYSGDVRFRKVGQFGINIRVCPNHPNLKVRQSMGMVLWGK